jgi:hypothetical protein
MCSSSNLITSCERRRSRPQGICRGIHEVSAIDITRPESSLEYRAPGPGFEIQHRDLGGVDAFLLRGDGEEQTSIAGQPCWLNVIELASLRVWPRQHGDLPAADRDALEACVGCAGGENDGVVRRPCRSARGAIHAHDSRRRAAGGRDLSQREVVLDVREPLAIGRREDTSQVGRGRQNGQRFERIQRSDQDLSGVAADVDKAVAVGRKREAAIRSTFECRSGMIVRTTGGAADRGANQNAPTTPPSTAATSAKAAARRAFQTRAAARGSLPCAELGELSAERTSRSWSSMRASPMCCKRRRQSLSMHRRIKDRRRGGDSTGRSA